MSFNPWRSFFKFTTSQRRGLFLLMTLIVFIQVIYFFTDFTEDDLNTSEKEEWLSLQREIDSLKLAKNQSSLMQPTYNPNFITDFKGYKLGMTTQEIDRLLAFRKMNKYINSAKEFQKITQISDSLLDVLSPQFKFSNWMNKTEKKIVFKDINSATKADLMRVYGIGTLTSDRIIKRREALSVFVEMDQLNDIWGLSPKIIENINKCFKIIQTQNVKKLKINTASIKELAVFPYFNHTLAKKIVLYRNTHDKIHDINDLLKINGFPVDKVSIITQYINYK